MRWSWSRASRGAAVSGSRIGNDGPMVPPNAGSAAFATVADLTISRGLHRRVHWDYERAFCSVLGIPDRAISDQIYGAVRPGERV